MKFLIALIMTLMSVFSLATTYTEANIKCGTSYCYADCNYGAAIESPVELAKCKQKWDTFAKCPQLYLPSSLTQGTNKTCKETWDFFVQKKSYCAMALMTINGLGGQLPDSNKIRNYLSKVSDNNDYDICRKDDEKTIEAIISAPDFNKTINLCDVLNYNAPSTQYYCAIYMYADAINNIKYTAHRKLSNLQQEILLQDAFNKYLVFIDSDNQVRMGIGQFAGSGRATWGWSSQFIMLNYFNHIMSNFFNHYPDKLKTKLTLKALDNKLDSDTKKILALSNKIPKKYSTDTDFKKNFAKAQNDWEIYRDSFVKFATIYYADKYKSDDITSIVTAYLVRRRVTEIEDQIATLKGSLEVNWFNYPQ